MLSVGIEVEFIFMNPTGNYHIPLKYFLENNNFTVYMVDSRKTLHLRKIMNLNTIKSDSEDTHVLAATPWHDPSMVGSFLQITYYTL